MIPRRMIQTKVLVSQQCSDASRCWDCNSTDIWSTSAAYHQFMAQHDIHIPPCHQLQIPSSGARTLTLPNVFSGNWEVFVYRISSYQPCQNFHWLLESRARYTGSPLPPSSWKAAYTARSCSYCSTRQMPTWTLRGQKMWITSLLCSFFLNEILACNYDWLSVQKHTVV